MRAHRVGVSSALAVSCLVAALGPATASAAEITQPCRTDPRAAPDWELQRLARWMSTTTSATPPPGSASSSGSNPQTRVGAFDAVQAALGDQAGGVGLDNQRGTFYVRFSPGALDAAAVHARFVRAVEETVPAEEVEAIRSRLRVVAQPYPEGELRQLTRSLFDRLRAERPGVGLGAGVGCIESDDVRVELSLYSDASAEDEAAVRRIAGEHGDRVVVVRRPYGPPGPGIGPAPVTPLQPVPRVPQDPSSSPSPAPRAATRPKLTTVAVARRRCGRRPSARIALAPAWRTRIRAFRVAAGPWRRTAATVPLRRAGRVEVVLKDGRTVVGRVARCA